MVVDSSFKKKNKNSTTHTLAWGENHHSQEPPVATKSTPIEEIHNIRFLRAEVVVCCMHLLRIFLILVKGGK